MTSVTYRVGVRVQAVERQDLRSQRQRRIELCTLDQSYLRHLVCAAGSVQCLGYCEGAP